MGDSTGIEWTDATWNPVRGCSRVSEGCRNCYAERIATRFGGEGMPYEGLTRNGRWTGVVRVIESVMDQPLRWRRPRRIFVNSMSDLFHEQLPFAVVRRVWGVMARAPHHTFQILTKRPERMSEWVKDLAQEFGVLPHVWLGTSIEDQRSADLRLPWLHRTRAAVRFVSAEPLLERMDILGHLLGGAGPIRRAPDMPRAPSGGHPGIHWLIAGSESGPGARPVALQALRDLRDQCGDACVAYFVKQLPIAGRTTTDLSRFPSDLRQRQFPGGA